MTLFEASERRLCQIEPKLVHVHVYKKQLERAWLDTVRFKRATPYQFKELIFNFQAPLAIESLFGIKSN